MSYPFHLPKLPKFDVVVKVDYSLSDLSPKIKRLLAINSHRIVGIKEVT